MKSTNPSLSLEKRFSRAHLYGVLSALAILGIFVTQCSPGGFLGTKPVNLPEDQAMAPQAIRMQPAELEEMPLDGRVEIEFDQPMNPEKTGAAFTVTDQDNKPVKGQINWPTARLLQFTPDQSLPAGTAYRISLSDKAVSADGTPLASPLDYQVNTGERLQVSQVFPLDNAEEVDPTTPLSVIFSRPVVALTVGDTPPTSNVLDFDPPVSGEGRWVSTSVYSFQPKIPLMSSTSYTVTVKGGLLEASQSQALALEKDYTWKFSTTSAKVVNFNIDGNQGDTTMANVKLEPTLSLIFNQPMDRPSTEAALQLSSSETIIPLGDPAWNDDSTQVSIKPEEKLQVGGYYTYSLKENAARSSDGGLMSGTWAWNFTTVPLPRILSTYPNNDESQANFSSELRIQFAAQMNPKTLNERVIISPALEKPSFYYQPYDYSLNIYSLKPATSYEVRLLPGMEDPYGNRINETTVVHFKTAALQPSAFLRLPEISLWRAGGPQEFYATFTNAPTAKMGLYRLTSEEYVRLMADSDYRKTYAANPDKKTWSTEVTDLPANNQQVSRKLTPKTSDGKLLSPGFYLLTLEADNIPSGESKYLDSKIVAVSDALLTFKMGAGESLLWLTDLEKGSPMSDIKVSIYSDSYYLLGQGTTGDDGTLHLDTPVPPERRTPRYAVTEDPTHLAFAISNWGTGVYQYDNQTWGGFIHSPDHKMAYVYTDRPLYRPGQPVYYKGIVRQEDDLAYRLPDLQKVHVAISNMDQTIFNEDVDLSPSGTFSGELNLADDATLGNYDIVASLLPADGAVGGGGGDNTLEIGRVSFSVAEYRRLEFQVNSNVARPNVLTGQDLSVDLSADYLSGGPVADAEVTWTMGSAPHFFLPQGEDLQGYNFIDDEAWQEFYNQEPVAYNQGTTRTDADGKATITRAVSSGKGRIPQLLTLESTVTDKAGSQVSDSVQAVVHPGLFYAGVRPRSYIGQAGEEQSFDLVVIDWDSKPVTNQALSVEIVEEEWFSVQEVDAEGQVRWKSTVKETPVAKFEDAVTGADGRASVSYTPPKGGSYRARVAATDTNGFTAKTSAVQWVSGKEYVSWQTEEDRRSLNMVTDRKSYKTGDTAEILITSPFEGSVHALVTVERSRIRKYEVISFDSNSYVYKLPVTADMAPNAYVSVLILKGVDEKITRPDYAVGLVELQVDPGVNSIKVEVTPDRKEAGPRDTVNFTVRTTDADGKPVKADVSLALSDLATLLLRPSNTPTLMDYFYSSRSVEINTAISLTGLLDTYNESVAEQIESAEALGGGSGGGGKGGGPLGVMDVRQDFPDTAFWRADVQTNDDGEATVAVTLPDNLTTWRMDARAVTEDTKVGQTTVDLMATKPLLLRPQTPRFFVEGDRATIGTAVHNNTDKALDIKVAIKAEGLSVSGNAIQEINMPAHSQSYASWQVEVPTGSHRVDLLFQAEGGGLSDASTPTLGTLDGQGIPVYRYEAIEMAGTSGLLDKGGAVSEAISLPSNLGKNPGELTVQVAPSLAAAMTDGLTYLAHYPYECIEQTVSRFLPNAVTVRALHAANLKDETLEKNLKEQINIAFQRLYKNQNADGGWGWWPGQPSNDLSSAYVLLGLVEAKASGSAVQEDVMERAVTYLQNGLATLDKTPPTEQANRQAFVLYVLGRAGKKPVNETVKLYEIKGSLGVYGTALLAQTLAGFDKDDPRLKNLESDLSGKAIMSAAGTHWEEKKADTYNWNTDLRTTAIVLNSLLQIDPQSALIPGAVRWLMSNRHAGYWRSTQETAWTLIALTNWISASGDLQADYNYAVAFNGERKIEGAATTDTLREVKEAIISTADILSDQTNRLTIGRSDGNGTLYYTAYLKGWLPVNDVPPVEHGITLTRSYYSLDDLKKPVSTTKWGDLLTVRLTIIAAHDLHYVVIDDPLPAGLEAVDTSLEGSPQLVEPPISWADPYHQGWGSWFFDHVEMHDEKVTLSATTLPAGTYVYTYTVRAATPGTFKVIPTTGQEFYFPDVFGRGAGSLFKVEQ